VGIKKGEENGKHYFGRRKATEGNYHILD